MKKVLVFGTFDILHPGHLYFLREAKKQGEHLTVVVTRDARVLSEKGRTPKLNEKERVEMVSALRVVDNVVLGDKIGEWKVLKRLKPHTVCVGYDQNPDWIKHAKLKRSPKIVQIDAYKPARHHSSKYYARH